jgi:hypothetical protein
MCNTEEGKRLDSIKDTYLNGKPKVRKIRITKKTKPFGLKLRK